MHIANKRVNEEKKNISCKTEQITVSISLLLSVTFLKSTKFVISEVNFFVNKINDSYSSF